MPGGCPQNPELWRWGLGRTFSVSAAQKPETHDRLHNHEIVIKRLNEWRLLTASFIITQTGNNPNAWRQRTTHSFCGMSPSTDRDRALPYSSSCTGPGAEQQGRSREGDGTHLQLPRPPRARRDEAASRADPSLQARNLAPSEKGSRLPGSGPGPRHTWAQQRQGEFQSSSIL